MERLVYIECGGYQSPRPLFTINKPYIGDPGVRVRIELCRPKNCQISIAEFKERQRNISEFLRYATTSDTCPTPQLQRPKHEQYAVAGTFNHFVKYFTDTPKTTNACDMAYNRKLTMYFPGESSGIDTGYTLFKSAPPYTYRVIELPSLLLSEHTPPATKENTNDDSDNEIDGPSPNKMTKIEVKRNKIYCILQSKVDISTAPEGDDGCKSIKGFNGLKCVCPFCKGYKNKADRDELRLWKRIIHRLPEELVKNVLQFMHYDQVSWLADKDDAFARSLAYHKYRVFDVYEKSKFPDARSVVRILRRKNATEMRFHGNEDLWIGSVGLTNGLRTKGYCQRYNIQQGTYTWCKVASATAVKLNSSRCACTTCIYFLTYMMKAMEENQYQTMVQSARSKIFALKGSERVPIDTHMSSAYWEDCTTSKDYDYTVHMWTNMLYDRWLQDLRTEDNVPLTVYDFNKIDKYRTLLFKDPVKFFGVSKIVQFIDRDVAALVSSFDYEVLGYLVAEQNYRFRVPENERQRIIGLNFVPDCTLKEVCAASETIRHVYRHDIEFTFGSLCREATRLEKELHNNPVNVEELAQQLTAVRSKMSKLQINKSRGVMLKRTLVRREILENDTLHVHETFSGDFEFCSRYMFEPLSETLPDDHMTRILNLLDVCADNSCNINVINREKLEGYLAIAQGGAHLLVDNYE